MLCTVNVYMCELRVTYKYKFPRMISVHFLKELVTGDQHQFSPNNIHTWSRDYVLRIYEMTIKEKMLWSAIKFSPLILKGNVWRSVWRICIWILGLKGLRDRSISPLAISLSILMNFSLDFVWILIDFGHYLNGTEVFKTYFYHLYMYLL